MAIIRDIVSLSALLNISRVTLRYWIKFENMPHKREGMKYYFDTNEVSEWLKTNQKRSHLVAVLDKYSDET